MSYKPKDTKERIIHRFKIASGQLNKVIKMTEENTYCIDILHQSQAIQKALKETDNLMLENHLKTCTANAIKSGKSSEAIKEIMEVLKRAK